MAELVVAGSLILICCSGTCWFLWRVNRELKAMYEDLLAAERKRVDSLLDRVNSPDFLTYKNGQLSENLQALPSPVTAGRFRGEHYEGE